MLHLLPQYQKTKIIKEYRMRLTVVILSLLFLVMVMFGVFTLPAFTKLFVIKKSLLADKSSYELIINSKSKKDGTGVGDASKSVQALQPFDKTLSPKLFIDAVASPSAGIKIDGYAFVQNQPGDPVSVVVNGSAKTREDLSSYAKLLNERFGGVKLPLSALAKQSDISFEFRFQATHDQVAKVVTNVSVTTN